MADIDLTKNRNFKALMSTGYLNNSTMGAILREVLDESIGPAGIVKQHWLEGQATWRDLKPQTVARKNGDRRKFYHSGRVYKAITQVPSGGKLSTWGSSADIYLGAGLKNQPKQFSAKGLYARGKINKKGAEITIGFSGKYKHSAGFNRVRRQMARETLGRGPKGKITAKEVRRTISVGQVQDRTLSMWLESSRRKGKRGKKPIRKTAAMGSQGFANGKFILARGDDNLAYADIVQRGKFMGLRMKSGMLMSPQGISGAKRRNIPASNFMGSKAEFGVKRNLMKYRDADIPRLTQAVEYGLNKIMRAAERLS